MVRFDRWLDSCNLIFVPIHSGNLGELGGHWWLLVIDPRRQVAEIWDSAPSTSSLPVRTRMAYNVLSHLQETVSGTLPGHDFQQYRTVTPANVPIQPNGFDCAIFVIQHMHMQYYGTRWWIDYHSDEQRSGILLQCMKSPASDIHDEVRRRADDYYFGRLC
ncbi:PREDICTED: uncharacterized protein LOC101292514 [Fragaria vesca subsp. vesca]|uniref:uncharacterized protein LOC101292514 n=1 Tax=Fragaria vesca subsp. vesca TaxID=101020 RepID=UPI0002C35F85|nr:PREDICTED: uncharacterized protein LOC101292514 [Fragaria vesca subsp. vesca]